MDDTSRLWVYGFAGGNKFKLAFPSTIINKPVLELKAHILHLKNFPVECQVVLICRDGNMFDVLKDDHRVPDLNAKGKSTTTLHVYMKKSAQTKNLEKTRQSDFDEWLKKIKENGMNLHYSAAAVPAVPAVAPRSRHPMQTLSTSHVSSSLIETSVYPVSEVATTFTIGGDEATEFVTEHAPTYEVQSAVGATKVSSNLPTPRARFIKHFNTESEHCLVCYSDTEKKAPTHYCYHCEERCCVLCVNCEHTHRQRFPDHEIEEYTPVTQRHQVDRLEESHRPQLYRPESAGWACPICTLVNLPYRLNCETCDSPRPGDYVIPDWYKPTPAEERLISTGAAAVHAQEPAALQWTCGRCTCLNLPHRPSCEMCMADRPADFHIPDDYEPTAEEMAFISGDVAARLDVEQVLEEERREEQRAREENRRALLNTDELNVIANDEEFECSICYTDCAPGDGVKLRECLHTFCRDCLRGHIESSETPEVRCPYMDDDYACNEILPEREIRQIAPEFYPKLLERGLQVAESQAENSFHCKSVNCPGWCTYEEDANFFQCPVCGVRNCLTCQAIHDNQDCKEYQDELKRKAEIDVEARKTQQEIQRLLDAREAMHCPKCKIVIMKKTGCDWIQCSVCHTEICWVTKQARWGPGGTGDNSGGCKCGVNGRCHPQCGNCH